MQAPEPMYATIGTSRPTGRGWTFEQKYDGMRVVAVVRGRSVGLFTRNGRDKAAQFPEIVDGLRRLGSKTRKSLILDGEIVALVRGSPAAFQALQSRMQLKDVDLVREKAAANPAALVLFDVLHDGREKLLGLPWHARRTRLERLLAGNGGERLILSESSPHGARMIARARRRGWEGIIAKQVDAPYVPGARSTAWLKLKLQHRAEFVVGGYTEPRRSRAHIGALLLGYFDAIGRLCYVGHLGGGFNRDSLHAMLERLKPLDRRTSPFTDRVVTNEPAHWVRPTVVVEVKFAEWTADGKLRQPIFLGVRDDKRARDVHREQESIQEWAQEIGGDMKRSVARPSPTVSKRKTPARASVPRGAAGSIVRQLGEIQASGGDGTLQFGRGKSLHVSSLDKPYFPADGITKGDVMRYYALLSAVLLPIIKDRPLILKRYPSGIDGQSFFQQNAGDNVPDGVRTAAVQTEGGQRADRIIGGDLLTLLYTVQIGTIAVHTWQSRIHSTDQSDSSTIDLDPGDDVPFSAVVDLARDIKAELDKLALHAAIKTSGSSGLHIAIPLPANTTFEESATLAQLVASRVVERRPLAATVERSVKARPKKSIYVDAQQNAAGKSVVAAYSVRERSGATVSAPLEWRELGKTLQLDAFTIGTMPGRVRKLGDLWGVAMKRRNTKRAIDRVLREV